VIFLQDKHDINALSKNIKAYVYSARNWGKAGESRLYASF
jgi:hypothetical protein